MPQKKKTNKKTNSTTFAQGGQKEENVKWYRRPPNPPKAPRPPIYPPLIEARTHIRLLKLLSTASEDEIKCESRVYPLEDWEGRYTAISYVWGDHSTTKQIKVNGHAIEVRWNCWYALWQTKYHKLRENKGNPYVWLDSLCIDQSNSDEKSQQVKLMGEIYSLAEGVFACLGPEGPDSEFIGKSSSPVEHDEKRSPIALHFAGRAYFRRVWTVQECILAKQIDVIIGRHRSDWNTVLRILGVHQTGVENHRPCARLMLLDSDMKYHRRSMDLAYIVYHYCNARECHNPRDKIYGFLSLVPEVFQNRIQLNYEKSLLRVLLDFCCVYDILDDVVESSARVNDSPSQTADTADKSLVRVDLGQFLKSLDCLVLAFRKDWHFIHALGNLSGRRRNEEEMDVHVSKLRQKGVSILWTPDRVSYHCVDFRRGDSMDDYHMRRSPQSATIAGVTKLLKIGVYEPSHFLIASRVVSGDVLLRITVGSSTSMDLLCRRLPERHGRFMLLGVAKQNRANRFDHENFTEIDTDDDGFRVELHPAVLMAKGLIDWGLLDCFDASLLPLNSIALPEIVVDDSIAASMVMSVPKSNKFLGMDFARLGLGVKHAP